MSKRKDRGLDAPLKSGDTQGADDDAKPFHGTMRRSDIGGLGLDVAEDGQESESEAVSRRRRRAETGCDETGR